MIVEICNYYAFVFFWFCFQSTITAAIGQDSALTEIQSRYFSVEINIQDSLATHVHNQLYKIQVCTDTVCVRVYNCQPGF